jgi:hypothetical protein
MTEDIRKAVIHAVSEASGLPVYGQRVPQGVKLPCFTVEMVGLEQKRLLGKRAERTVIFEVRYFYGEEKTAAEESTLAIDGLYEALLIIGKDEKFAASGMKHEKMADGVKFTVEYEYHIIFTEEEAEKMERLKYNGKEAVGYEKIQQREAE